MKTQLLALIAVASLFTIGLWHIDRWHQSMFQTEYQLEELDQPNLNHGPIQTKLTLQDNGKQKWTCLNGKDPKTLSPQEQLLEFAQGPCSPIIMLPGVMATSLIVQIDCEVLQSKNSEIFQSCGWETCSKLEFWKKMPQPEYTVWIGELFGPQTLVQFSSNTSCWGNLVSLQFDVNTKQWKHPDGLQVSWKGNTVQSASESQCGNIAVQDISKSKMLASCETILYKKFINLLDGQGYQYGVTYQSIPYDFRFGVNEGNTTQTIQKSLQNLYQFTGKKVIVIGHSLGTIHGYTAITRMLQADRDKYVKLFLAVAPPFLGSIQTISDHLAGNFEYTKKIIKKTIGIDYINQKKFIHSSASSIFNLYSRDAFVRFRSSEWLQEILKRIEYENNFEKYKNIDQLNVPLNYLPKPNETCYLQHNCTSGLIDLSTDCYAKIADKVYYCDAENWKQFFRDQCYEGDVQEQAFENSILNELDNLQNPGVPTAIVYSTIFNVSKNFDFYVDQLDKANNKTFGYANKSQDSIGDGTVLSTSALAPAFKWIWEYKNRERLNDKTFKPIKLIQYCSLQNQQQGIYDSVDSNGERVFQEQVYQGIDCQCKKESQKAECAHSCIINDDSMVTLVNDAIITNEKSQLIEEIKAMFTSSYIENWQQRCPNLVDTE